MSLSDNMHQQYLKPDELELTIFVPCYNEETRVKGTLETIRDAMREIGKSYEVLVVDDGSKDRTCEVVEEFQKQNPTVPIIFLKNPHNLGLARGFVETAFVGRGKYYRLVCGDNVEPKETMIKIIKMMGETDIILPYYPKLPGKSKARLLISGLFTFLVNLLSGFSVRYYNGCALYRRYHVMRWAPYNYGFGFQADLITLLLEEGAGYKEVAVEGSHFEKEKGGSPLTLRNFISTGHTLFRILMRRVRRIMFNRVNS